MNLIKYTKIALVVFFFILMMGPVTGESEAWPRHRGFYYRPVRVVRVVRPYRHFAWMRGHYRLNGYGFLVWVPGHWRRV
jgi:hypothetical protein